MLARAAKSGSLLKSYPLDTVITIYIKLFKKRRVEQLEAVKSLQKLHNYEQQYNMIMLMAEKVFTVIQNSRAHLESSGYIPGVSTFPMDETTKDALSNVLENTALFSEMIIRLPDISTSVLKINNNWDILLQWSIAFSNQVKYLLDNSTIKLLHFVSQELSHAERDPNYINPYRKDFEKKHRDKKEQQKIEKKKKKQIRKGPRFHDEF